MMAIDKLFGVVPLTMVRDKRISLNDIRVYVALSSFAGTKDKCWPSIKKIAERSGVHQSHISKHTGKLEKLGYLTRVRRGKRISNTYWMADRGLLGATAHRDIAGRDKSEHAKIASSECADAADSNKKTNNEQPQLENIIDSIVDKLKARNKHQEVGNIPGKPPS